MFNVALSFKILFWFVIKIEQVDKNIITNILFYMHRTNIMVY